MITGHDTCKNQAGSNVTAATANATVGSVWGAAVKIDEDIGVDLKITPTIRSDGLAMIEVEVTRTFLQPPDASINFEFKIQTAKTHVQATVVMAFGETLSMSGLSEQETERFRDGVPDLQDIPILQYFFSEQRILNFQRSVLVLITPRSPFTLNSLAEDAPVDDSAQEIGTLKEHQRRFDSWFRPAPHWVAVVQKLEESGLYREFRAGDLKLQTWSESKSFRKRFGDVVEFLYY